jgi:hypothetical protein
MTSRRRRKEPLLLKQRKATVDVVITSRKYAKKA